MTKNLALALAAAVSMTFAACNNKTAEENAENMDGDTTMAQMGNAAENMDGDSTNMNGTAGNGAATGTMTAEQTENMTKATSARTALAARIEQAKSGLASAAAADKTNMEKAIDKMQAELEALDKNIAAAKTATATTMDKAEDDLEASIKRANDMAEMKMEDMLKANKM